jgi:nitroimidazol reductase NimA-like FMN-containing flavoprotein (pyridoxamine 5'-phosphate oxidase superfamily)
MPRRLAEQEQQQFLAETHIAVLSVPSDDERPPLTFPIWYGYQPGGDVTYYTHRTSPPSRKLRLLHEGTPVSLCVQREELPYKYVTVEGTVVGEDDSPSFETMFAIVRRYLPEEAARAYVQGEVDNPDIGLVVFTIRPDRWASFDFGDDAG